jgi:hypothetical protein
MLAFRDVYDRWPRWFLKSRVRAIVVAAALALPLPCSSEELGRLDVIMKPFETSGQVDPELAKSLWSQLAQSIERHSDFRIAAGGSAYYYLEGRMSSDGKRQFVALQLFKAKTDRAIWLQNYDYRGMSADRMATDVIEALSSVTRSDTWN